MKAKKVYEMIDPYTSEEDAMDLDVSYKNKILRKGIEEWFTKWAPGEEYTIDKDLNIVVNGSIDLENIAIDVKLPDNMTIHGWLDVRGSLVSEIPNNLTIYGNFWVSSSKITYIPNDLHVTDILYCWNMDSLTLADNLTLTNLDIDDSGINELPENLTITGMLSLRKTNIYKLPASLKVKDRIYKDF